MAASYTPGSRYDEDAVLLAMQAPVSAPSSTQLPVASSPLQPPPRAADTLAHFYEEIYDLTPESHLSRLLKVFLGDAGTNQLRKRYMTSRLHDGVLTTQFYDLDKLYSFLLGLRRLSFEAIDFNPYTETATSDEWAAAVARDSNYRARVVAFSRSLQLTGTKAGMIAASSAVLGGSSVALFETYEFVDSLGGNFGTFVGDSTMFGRTGATHNRSEVVIVPSRTITPEERYELTRLLTRLKPANVLLTVSDTGFEIVTQVPIQRVAADSTYWEITNLIAPAHGTELIYPRQPNVVGQSVEQPKFPFTQYQGEAWSYNADVTATSSYALDASGTQRSGVDYERRVAAGHAINYTPDKALSDPTEILLGRYTSDAIMTTSPYDRSST